MKMYILCTPSHENMLTKYSLPSLQDNVEVIIDHKPQECPTANYMEPGYLKTMARRLDLILNAIMDNWGKYFIFAGCDIIYLKPMVNELLDSVKGYDLAAQHEWPNQAICADFLIIQGNQKTLALIQAARTMMDLKGCHDQDALNIVLREQRFADINWKTLPIDLFPNGAYSIASNRVNPNNIILYTPNTELLIPPQAMLVHVNFCFGVANKEDFLKKIWNKNKNITTTLF